MGKKSATEKEKLSQVVVAVSGGFDPLHIGHARMFKEAKRLGTQLVVILNNDNWLKNKKGYAFMPEKERAELIRALPEVDRVVLTDHKMGDADMSVGRTLRKLEPHIFANGGDRKSHNTPEDVVCKELGIKMKFNVGRGGKVQSSSWMVADAAKDIARTDRPWGSFYDWDGGEKWHLKTIRVLPGKRLSLQRHALRAEMWVLVEGDVGAVVAEGSGKEKRLITRKLKFGEPFFIKKHQIHRLQSQHGGTIVELALGQFDEEDIERLEDDFGRV